MSTTDSAPRGRAEPIDVDFEPAGRAQRQRGGDGGLGFFATLMLALLAAVSGAIAGLIVPRIPAVQAYMESSFPSQAAPSAAQPAASTAEFNGLDQRVRSIETLISNPTATTASADGGDVGPRILQLQAGLRDVETKLGQIPSSQQIQALVAEVQRLNAQLPAVEQQSRSAGEAARAAFAVAAAAEASRSSGPFEQSYRALAALLPDDPNVRALAPLARTGAPTRVELRDSFNDVEIQVLRAARQSQAGAGFWGRIQAAMAQWVTVRKAGEGDTPAGVVERAGRRLAADDLAGAIQELSRLSGPAARAAGPWLSTARRRLEIDTRLAAIRTELSRRG
ncbi:MAG: hypothetical protein JNJ73_02335 [Hyphomonadaceae bacterium]|nr:hypothetical protein [Hyphomonadaceae bacterium]